MPKKQDKQKRRIVPRKRILPTERISPRDAAIAASRYYFELTGSDRKPSIEEMELTEDKKFWLVTLGYEKSPFVTGMKEYKLFKINAYTGEVITMRIRNIER